jgi:hypothetical protein
MRLLSYQIVKLSFHGRKLVPGRLNGLVSFVGESTRIRLKGNPALFRCGLRLQPIVLHHIAITGAPEIFV